MFDLEQYTKSIRNGLDQSEIHTVPIKNGDKEYPKRQRRTFIEIFIEIR